MLGLVGAALGIDRKNVDTRQHFARIRWLSSHFSVRCRFATTTRCKPFRLPEPKSQQPENGHWESVTGDANTVITIRDYRCDVLIGVAVWGDGLWGLKDLADCLRRPEFPLYLGRKSCPLASPLNPVVTFAAGPAEALACIEVPEWLHSNGLSDQSRLRCPVHSDPMDEHAPPSLSERVPGEPLDRQAWTFGECTVWLLDAHRVEQGAEGGEA